MVHNHNLPTSVYYNMHFDEETCHSCPAPTVPLRHGTLRSVLDNLQGHVERVQAAAACICLLGDAVVVRCVGLVAWQLDLSAQIVDVAGDAADVV